MSNKRLIKRGLKYMIQFLILFMASRFVPSVKIDLKEVTTIAMVGAISFAILDMYSPTINYKDKKVDA